MISGDDLGHESKKRARRGGAVKIFHAMLWNTGFALVGTVVQVGIAMIMARLLTPTDYGVFALSNAIVIFGMHISQRGLTTTLLRKKNLAQEDISCSYLVSATISLSFIVIIFVGAKILVWAWGEVQRVQSDILLFMAIPLVVGIMATPADALLQRRLAMGRVNLFSFIGTLLGNGGVAIGFAVSGYGPWSLAFGAAAASATTALLMLWTEPPPTKFLRCGKGFGEMIREAIILNGIRAMGTAWVQLPLIVLGLRAPASIVGIYQRMQFFADIMLQTTVCRVTGIFYVVLASREVDHIKNYRLLFLLTGTLVIPIIAFVWVASEPLIEVILGPAWLSGAWVFRMLIVAFGIYTLNNQAAGIVLEISGRYWERFASLSAATILIGALSIAMPLEVSLSHTSLMALPAVVSIGVSAVLVHAFMGERISSLLQILGLLKGGLVMGSATAGGALFGSFIAERYHVYSALLLLLIQFGMAIALVIIVIPMVARIDEMRPFLDVAKKLSPGLYSRLAPILGAR